MEFTTAPARCVEYWALYFARDTAAANLLRVQALHADGGQNHPDVVYADSCLDWALQLQARHLRACPVCQEWLQSLPDGQVFDALPAEMEDLQNVSI